MIKLRQHILRHIIGNNGNCGGVYVDSDSTVYGTFRKSGSSTIDAANSAKQGKAAYIYIEGASPMVRNSAAGPGVDLDSSKTGAFGGWE